MPSFVYPKCCAAGQTSKSQYKSETTPSLDGDVDCVAQLVLRTSPKARACEFICTTPYRRRCRQGWATSQPRQSRPVAAPGEMVSVSMICNKHELGWLVGLRFDEEKWSLDLAYCGVDRGSSDHLGRLLAISLVGQRVCG